MKLYPFQKDVLDRTRTHNRVGYFLDMGLGKTFVGSEKACRLGAPVTLVVCQKSKVRDWVSHFKTNHAAHERDCCHERLVFDLTDGKQLERFLSESESATRPGPVEGPRPYMTVGAINYDLAFRRPRLLGLRGFTLVLDESSQIQNEKAKRTKFILAMSPSNVVLLSGTPTGGKYENLWAQARMLGWGVSQKVFDQHYVNWKTINVGGVPLRVVDMGNPYKNVERLKRKLREHGAVFLKTDDVLELPEQTVIEVRVPTTGEYRKFQKDRIVTVGGGTLVGDTALTKRLYDRMLCGHLNPAKLDAFRDLLESTGDRLVAFYNFNAEFEALRGICAELGRPVSEVSGRAKDLTAYEAAENSVTLAQYQAGATGLNLQLANKAIYFTPTDKSELFEQSKKRIHRIGQKRPCFYYLLVCPDSVEDREIFPALGLRKTLTDDLFVNTENFFINTEVEND